MQQGKTREQLLQEWKEQRAARAAPGGQPQQAAAPPSKAALPGTVPAWPGRENDSDNAVSFGASRPGGLSREEPAGHPDQQRQAQPKQQMEQQFDLLQGRLHALKRNAARPEPQPAARPTPAAATQQQQQPALPAAARQQPTPQPAAAAGAASAAVAAAAAATAAMPPPPPPHVTSRQREDVDAGAASTTATFNGLAARLESLRRESVRPSFAGGGAAAQGGLQFEAAGQIDTQALSRLALALFEEREFKALVERGMGAQLTRSRDGATEETKIKELAGEAGWGGAGGGGGAAARGLAGRAWRRAARSGCCSGRGRPGASTRPPRPAAPPNLPQASSSCCGEA